MNDMTVKQQFSLTPTTFDEAMRFCSTLAKSELVPKDFIEKPANILVAVQWGMELGLQPLQAMQSIAVINGRPSLWGDAVIALVRANSLCEWIREEIGDNQATCTTKRQGEEPQSRTFTVDDAKKAGLWGKQGPWSNYPKRMMQMRARAWCLRDVYPDVLRGVHVAEESQDLEKDVTPAAEVPGPTARVEPKPAPIDVKEEPTKAAEPAAAATPASTTATTETQPATTSAQPAAAQASSGNGNGDKPATEGQLRILRAKLAQAALTEVDLEAKFGKVAALKFDQFDQVQAWIAERGKAIAGG